MSLWRVCGRVAEMWRNKGASSFCSSQSEKMFSGCDLGSQTERRKRRSGEG